MSAGTLTVRLLGASIWGPGLAGWAASVPLLRGRTVPTEDATVVPIPTMLPANERRRAGLLTRLALAAAADAAGQTDISPSILPAVFASASGEGAVIHDLLETLATPGADISPTCFHNSVHNAAAGYWSIGAAAQAETDSLGAHDETAAAALLAAAAAVASEDEPRLLVAADVPMPPPLAAARPIGAAFAGALVLAPAEQPAPVALGRMTLAFTPTAVADDPPHAPALAALARTTPAARLLRLLEALAAGRADQFALSLAGGHLALTLAPGSAA